MTTQHLDEKKPTDEGGLLSPSRDDLEAIAEKMAAVARSCFRSAEAESTDYGRRFIEHGAVCYFNCWAMLRGCLDASSLPPSSTPGER